MSEPQSSNLVSRLRDWKGNDFGPYRSPVPDLIKAADEIERLLRLNDIQRGEVNDERVRNDRLANQLAAAERLAKIMTSAAGKHAERVVELESAVETPPPASKEENFGTDERCLDLAKHFLCGGASALGEPQDCVTNRTSLSRAIQRAVEDWFAEVKS